MTFDTFHFLLLLLFPLMTHSTITWIPLIKKLPQPLSDLTATLYPRNVQYTTVSNSHDDISGSIILTGGCSHPNGNIEFQIGEDLLYVCPEITNQTWAFNPYTETLRRLPDMKVPRYRHSAVIVNDNLYVIGGVDVEDNIINHIDVMDLTSHNSWQILRTLPTRHVTTDNTAIGYNQFIYILGGYDAFYNAQTTTLEYNTLTNEIIDKRPMHVSRGDASAVTYTFPNGSVRAYIMGGFSHENDFCHPLDKGEMYDFDTDTWTFIDSLTQHRGDKAVVMLRDTIYTIGGETKHEEMCTNPIEPQSHAVTVPDIETYIVTEPNAQWKVQADIPYHRFRAAAAAVESTSTVYLFGGQLEYNETCRCYPTSNVILAFRDVDVSSKSSSSSSSSCMNMIPKSLFMFSGMMLMVVMSMMC